MARKKEITTLFKGHTFTGSCTSFNGSAHYISAHPTQSCCGAFELSGLINLFQSDRLSANDMAYWMLLYRQLCKKKKFSMVFCTVPVQIPGGETKTMNYKLLQDAFHRIKIFPVAQCTNHVHRGLDEIALYILYGEVKKGRRK